MTLLVLVPVVIALVCCAGGESVYIAGGSCWGRSTTKCTWRTAG